MDKLLIIGGSGFLGGHLADMAASVWETVVSFHTKPVNGTSRFKAVSLDISHKEEVEKVIYSLSPQVIINTAAISDIHRCEAHKDLAWGVNFTGSKNVAEVSENIGARLIHISTDLVFDGIKGNYSEQDSPHPLSNYGQSKLEADNFITSFSSNYSIVRPSLIYGSSLNSSESSIEKMLHGFQRGEPYRGFTDEYRNPIYVNDLSSIILKLAQSPEFNELFHVCGPERLSRYDFALNVCSTFDLDRSLAIPAISDDYPLSKLRPKDCSMDFSNMKQKLMENILSVRDGLHDMKTFSIAKKV